MDFIANGKRTAPLLGKKIYMHYEPGSRPNKRTEKILTLLKAEIVHFFDRKIDYLITNVPTSRLPVLADYSSLSIKENVDPVTEKVDAVFSVDSVSKAPQLPVASTFVTACVPSSQRLMNLSGAGFQTKAVTRGRAMLLAASKAPGTNQAKSATICTLIANENASSDQRSKLPSKDRTSISPSGNDLLQRAKHLGIKILTIDAVSKWIRHLPEDVQQHIQLGESSYVDLDANVEPDDQERDRICGVRLLARPCVKVIDLGGPTRPLYMERTNYLSSLWQAFQPQSLPLPSPENLSTLTPALNATNQHVLQEIVTEEADCRTNAAPTENATRTPAATTTTTTATSAHRPQRRRSLAVIDGGKAATVSAVRPAGAHRRHIGGTTGSRRHSFYAPSRHKLVRDIATEPAGFCECCSISYTNLYEHVYSKDHRQFAENDENFRHLDQLLGQLPSFATIFTAKDKVATARPTSPDLSPGNLFASPPSQERQLNRCSPSAKSTMIDGDLVQKEVAQQELCCFTVDGLRLPPPPTPSVRPGENLVNLFSDPEDNVEVNKSMSRGVGFGYIFEDVNVVPPLPVSPLRSLPSPHSFKAAVTASRELVNQRIEHEYETSTKSSQKASPLENSQHASLPQVLSLIPPPPAFEDTVFDVLEPSERSDVPPPVEFADVLDSNKLLSINDESQRPVVRFVPTEIPFATELQAVNRTNSHPMKAVSSPIFPAGYETSEINFSIPLNNPNARLEERKSILLFLPKMTDFLGSVHHDPNLVGGTLPGRVRKWAAALQRISIASPQKNVNDKSTTEAMPIHLSPRQTQSLSPIIPNNFRRCTNCGRLHIPAHFPIDLQMRISVLFSAQATCDGLGCCPSVAVSNDDHLGTPSCERWDVEGQRVLSSNPPSFERTSPVFSLSPVRQNEKTAEAELSGDPPSVLLLSPATLPMTLVDEFSCSHSSRVKSTPSTPNQPSSNTVRMLELSSSPSSLVFPLETADDNNLPNDENSVNCSPSNNLTAIVRDSLTTESRRSLSKIQTSVVPLSVNADEKLLQSTEKVTLNTDKSPSPELPVRRYSSRSRNSNLSIYVASSEKSSPITPDVCIQSGIVAKSSLISAESFETAGTEAPTVTKASTRHSSTRKRNSISPSSLEISPSTREHRNPINAIKHLTRRGLETSKSVNTESIILSSFVSSRNDQLSRCTSSSSVDTLPLAISPEVPVESRLALFVDSDPSPRPQKFSGSYHREDISSLSLEDSCPSILNPASPVRTFCPMRRAASVAREAITLSMQAFYTPFASEAPRMLHPRSKRSLRRQSQKPVEDSDWSVDSSSQDADTLPKLIFRRKKRVDHSGPLSPEVATSIVPESRKISTDCFSPSAHSSYKKRRRLLTAITSDESDTPQQISRVRGGGLELHTKSEVDGSPSADIDTTLCAETPKTRRRRSKGGSKRRYPKCRRRLRIEDDDDDYKLDYSRSSSS